MFRAAISLSTLVLFGACYRYTPVSGVSPDAGSVVRLDLTDAGAERLGPILGRNAVAVEGTILSASDTAFVVSMAGTRQRGEQGLAWAGEHVVVPRTAVQTVERRSLDKKKTFLVAGFAILGAIGLKLIVSGYDALAGGDDGGITPPPP